MTGSREESSGKCKDRAWAEINLEYLRHNVKVFQEVLPADCVFMAVVKANAYGHGVIPVSHYLNRLGVRSFAVAAIDEAVEMRKEGIEGDILIFGYTPCSRADDLYQYCLTQTVVDADHARELNEFGKPIQVHIKVNTGMNRLGESYRHGAEIASIFGCENLRVTGIYTHFSVADSLDESDIAYTRQQLQNYQELLDELKARKIDISRSHTQSSYGVLNYPELQCDYARIGISLYGVYSTSDTNTACTLDLKPVLALKSRITLTRSITAGESVGYGRSFVAPHEMRIAVVPFGYADGYPRNLTAKGHVLVRGCRAPVIGRVCMDQMMIDITQIPDAQRGDVVTLLGKDGTEEITAEQIATSAGTLTNEILSRLNSMRLQRVYLNF